MKVVIQCAGLKQPDPRRLRKQTGEEIVFVAHPEQCESTPLVRYCRPDDTVGPDDATWRDTLATYHREGTNPNQLRRAADLYRPKVYRALVDAFDWPNVFILSAGWGLIRSDFLTPDYDITFSGQGKPQSRRSKTCDEPWMDFNHLQDYDSPDDTVHFFGGLDYLQLYYTLTQHLSARKIIHYKGRLTRRQDYDYAAYSKPGKQNWHYAAARDFISRHQ